MLVLKWFLSTLKQQHNTKDENGKKKRLKPLNPFLGEIFLGKYQDEAGTTHLVSEQVSHHPPATAFNLWNDLHGVRVGNFSLYRVISDGSNIVTRPHSPKSIFLEHRSHRPKRLWPPSYRQIQRRLPGHNAKYAYQRLHEWFPLP